MPRGRNIPASGQSRYAVGLYRVSTAEQGQSGLGLDAQRAAVRAFVAAQGWALVAEYEDVASGKDDRRPGFQSALQRCRQLGAILVAARLDRITRRAHTLSGLLEEGISLRAADMPGADDLMLRVYAAMAQKERELISGRIRAALAAARARGRVLGGDRGYRPTIGPDARDAAQARRDAADRAAHLLSLEEQRLSGALVVGQAALVRGLNARGVLPTRWMRYLDAHARDPGVSSGRASDALPRVSTPDDRAGRRSSMSFVSIPPIMR